MSYENGSIGDMINQSLEEIMQEKTCGSISRLDEYLRAFVLEKGNPDVTVIDQRKGAVYNITQENSQQMFELFAQVQAENAISHMLERQATPKQPHGGIMLDFDIFSKTMTVLSNPLKEDHCQRITNIISMKLLEILNLQDTLQFHIIFTQKRAPVKYSEGLIKWGMHILIPGIQVQRPVKRWLIKQLIESAGMNTILKEIGADEPEKCLDTNSASVPVLYYGSCKRGKIPYVLHSLYKVTAYAGGPISTSTIDNSIVYGYNMIGEMSLMFQAQYSGGKPPLIIKRVYNPKPELEETINNWSVKTSAPSDMESIETIENSIATHSLTDPEFKQIYAMLDILKPEYYTDRTLWRNVIFALASMNNPTYKQLAIWFSQKCPEKWAAGGESALDQIWLDAMRHHSSNQSTFTYRSIYYWAKTSNPEKFVTVRQQSYFMMLVKFIYQFDGILGHDMIAQILFSMLNSKYCTDTDCATDSIDGGYFWYEFVTTEQTRMIGEVWKWRKTKIPLEMHIYMSDKLTIVFNDVISFLKKKRDNEQLSKEKAKYFEALEKRVRDTMRKLFDDHFKNGVLKQALYRFHRRGFAQSLDKQPRLFGVANGVLELGAKCRLIDYYHEYAISKYTPASWVPLDSTSYYVRLALGFFETVIPESDARDFLLYSFAQCLSPGPKEGICFILDGGGGNAKTAILRQIAAALGQYAIKFNVQLLCNDREDPDKPNSALMSFKGSTFAYAEETNKAQTLSPARFKEIVNVGEISSRELRKKQELFTACWNVYLATQYYFIINTHDHGTWRRLYRYLFKMKFRAVPDPNNRFERKEDKRFNRDLISDPEYIGAVLSILVHYYERLQNNYGGLLQNVPCPTIQRETEQYRISQDMVHRWITECIVQSPVGEIYPISGLAQLYNEWYMKNVNSRVRLIMSEVINELESSVLSKYLKLENRIQILYGCRVLTADLRVNEGESFLSTLWVPPAIQVSFEHKDNWWLDPETTPAISRHTSCDSGLHEDKKLDRLISPIVDFEII